MLNVQKTAPLYSSLFFRLIVLSALFAVSGIAYGRGSGKASAREAVPGEIIIGFVPDASAEEIADTYQRHGLKEKEALSQQDSGETPITLVKSSAKLENIIRNLQEEANASWSPVDYVEPNYIVHVDVNPPEKQPNDPLFPKLWGLSNRGQNGGTPFADIHAIAAWAMGTGSSDTIVAIIDTGVDFTHPDLAPNMWTNPYEIPGNGIDDDHNGYKDDVYGINAITNAGNPMDNQGHGTHTAGTIAGSGNNGIGVTGVNWNAKIIACKFLDAFGSGSTSDAVKCFLYLNRLKQVQGVNIVVSNNSWGGGGFSQALEDAMSNRDQPNMKPILHAVAAGNSNSDNDTRRVYPAALNLPNMISVAATDSNDNYASFSNYGAKSVDLAAPGVDILSTVPTGTCALCDESGYRSLKGTSMATPHVVGGAALVFSQFPGSSAREVKKRILENADFIGNKPANATKSTLTNGRLNVYRALGGRLPSIGSGGNISVTEGNSGTLNASFTVLLSAASSEPVTVNYSTANATATAGSDYQAKSGTLTFAPGVTSQTISIAVMGDTVTEPDETFFVNLSNAVNASIEFSQMTGTILNDDFYLSIDKAFFMVEGHQASFNVRLSAPSTKTITVNYATADGTATAGSDYQIKSGVLTFAPGVTNQIISIATLGDTITPEPDETFFINLSNPSNAQIGVGQGICTIRDNPLSGYALTIEDVSMMEGNTGMVNAVFTVRLSNASTNTVTVRYATADIGSATAGSDYKATSGVLTFAPGVTSQPLSIVIIGDTVTERDEMFAVNLFGPKNATILRSQGWGTILNDDTYIAISDDQGSYLNEGGTGAFLRYQFLVDLSAPTSQTVLVNYATADGTATAGSDYQATSGTLTFKPGSTTRQFVNVTVYGDDIAELDETFFVNLSNPINAPISRSQGMAKIINDDYNLSIGGVSVIEGNSGTVNAVFPITLWPAARKALTVDYATADGKATARNDYQAKSGTLTFAPDVTSQTISIAVKGDTMVEPDETFFVNLSNANIDDYTHVSIIDSQGIGTILNDDYAGKLAITNNVSVVEGNSGTVNAIFKVSLFVKSQVPVTVDYATADGTATAGSDYQAKSGTLTFAPGGVTSQSISIAVNSDTMVEPDETFFVNLSNAGNANISISKGIGTIKNDDFNKQGNK